MRVLAKKIFYNCQFIISFLLYYFFYRFKNDECARIIMYHSISNFPKEDKIPYDNVEPAIFESHLKILKDDGYNVISLGQLVKNIKYDKKIKPKTIVITLDDGFKNNYDYAFPLLKKYGFSATMFIISGYIGETKLLKHLLMDKKAKEYCSIFPESRMTMSEKEIRELSDWGIEIGSHSVTHRSLGNIDVNEARTELFESKSSLEKITDKKIDLFSYPFGSITYRDLTEATEKLLAEAEYTAACTTEIGRVCINTPLYQLPRIPIREKDGYYKYTFKIKGAYEWINVFKNLFQKNVKRLDITD